MLVLGYVVKIPLTLSSLQTKYLFQILSSLLLLMLLLHAPHKVVGLCGGRVLVDVVLHHLHLFFAELENKNTL